MGRLVTMPAMIIPNPSPFPPSFDGNAWTFGWALFSLTTISALSFAALGQMWRQATIYGWRFNEPIGISRAVTACLMMTIFVGAFPDVLFLYAWGEAKPETLALLLLLDRSCDGLTIVPFTTAILLLLRGLPSIQFQLTKQPLPVNLWPTWPMVRSNFAIIGLVLLIATGVTIAK